MPLRRLAKYSVPSSSAAFLDAGEGGHQFLDARADESDGDFLIVAEIAHGDDGAVAELGMRYFIARAETGAIGGGRRGCTRRLPACDLYLGRREGGQAAGGRAQVLDDVGRDRVHEAGAGRVLLVAPDRPL